MVSSHRTLERRTRREGHGEKGRVAFRESDLLTLVAELATAATAVSARDPGKRERLLPEGGAAFVRAAIASASAQGFE